MFLQLTSLECDDVPSAGLFPHLSHCKLRARACNQEGPRCDRLLQFLASTPFLQSLDFSLDNSDTCGEIGTNGVSLPKLKRPAIHLEESSLHTQFMHYCTQFMYKLGHPSLEHMKITVSNASDLLELVASQLFSAVKKLEVVLQNHRTSLSLSAFHTNFPSLERLSIEIDDFLPSWDLERE